KHREAVHRTLAMTARLKILGKSPVGFYLRVNRWVWHRLPSRIRNLSLMRWYGAWLHALARLSPNRQQYFATFFLRNRPALELTRCLAQQKAPGSTLRIAVMGCSLGAEVYSILWTIRSVRPDLKVIVCAVDISKEILNFAEKGIYGPSTSELAGV